MGWWVTALRRLAGGAEHERFLFMDGPFAVDARYDREMDEVQLAPQGESFTWQVRLGELAAALRDAAEAMAAGLAGAGVSGPAAEQMREAAHLLDGVLAGKAPARA